MPQSALRLRREFSMRLGELAGGPSRRNTDPDATRRRLVIVGEAAARALERGRELIDPYQGINRILIEKPRVVPLEDILTVYAIHASRNGRNQNEIQRGMVEIAEAYEFGQQQFYELGEREPGKRYRKDGETPLFAHSTRLAEMAAYLGGESEIIRGLLLHDVVEDCGVQLKELLKQFGARIRGYVALWTKPKLIEVRKTGRGYAAWAYVVECMKDPERWEALPSSIPPEKYRERHDHQFDQILNTKARGITPKMKLRAYIGKILDALDSFVTDQHLDPTRAEARVYSLMDQMPLVDRADPTLGRIIRRLLNDRGFVIPASRPNPEHVGKKLIEVPPLTGAYFNAHYLRSHPLPNGHFLVYSKCTHMQRQLERATFSREIRTELPHDVPPNTVERLARFLESRGLSLQLRTGKSAMPTAAEGAGCIIWIGGIRNMSTYQQFLDVFEQFHGVLRSVIDGTGPMP